MSLNNTDTKNLPFPIAPKIASGYPAKLGYRFPAEWEQHYATWLSWPHKEASWPGKIDSIYPVYAQFIKELLVGERVHINVNDAEMELFAINELKKVGANLEKVKFFRHTTDDAWCRDHGPAFLVKDAGNANSGLPNKVIVDWGYNAWGNKYPPFDHDDEIPTKIAEAYQIPVFHPGIVMEGGSVDFNGAGTLLTTTACLLNENRNPDLSQSEIEQYLKDYYGVQQILWLKDGIIGDDTDGHIDDITRFVNHNTVVTVVEENTEDENHAILEDNLELLKGFRLLNGQPLNIRTLPMPKPVVYDGQRLPASYANFYIGNEVVVVPTYKDEVNDIRALEILKSCFPDRRVIGLDSTDLIWGLGSFHCLSQQEPLV